MKELNDPIVISGIGMVSSLGISSDATWENICLKKTNISRRAYNFQRSKMGCFSKHEIADFNCSEIKNDFDFNLVNEVEHWKKESLSVDFCAFIKLIKSACLDADLKVNGRRDVGLILSHENIGMEPLCRKFLNSLYQGYSQQNSAENNSVEAVFRNFFDEYSRNVYETQQFMPLYHVAKIFDIHGFSLFVNNACSSGLYALETATALINSQRCESVIVASCDFQDIFKMMWLKEMGLYSLNERIRPFHKDRDGFIPGEGGAALVVESLSTALARGRKVYGTYLGGGFFQEGWKVSLPRLGGDSLSNCINEALVRSSTKPEEIDLICLHGVGTRLNDAIEVQSLEKSLGKTLLRSTAVAVYKPYIGHLLGASALIEAALSLISLNNEIVIPFIEPEELEFDLCYSFEKKAIPMRRVLKICSGFGGYNSAVVFGK